MLIPINCNSRTASPFAGSQDRIYVLDGNEITLI